YRFHLFSLTAAHMGSSPNERRSEEHQDSSRPHQTLEILLPNLAAAGAAGPGFGDLQPALPGIFAHRANLLNPPQMGAVDPLWRKTLEGPGQINSRDLSGGTAVAGGDDEAVARRRREVIQVWPSASR